jgi:hypothetical protein
MKTHARCPFCNRQHSFEVDDRIPIQKFDIHHGSVEAQTRVIEHTRQWGWILKRPIIKRRVKSVMAIIAIAVMAALLARKIVNA